VRRVAVFVRAVVITAAPLATVSGAPPVVTAPLALLALLNAGQLLAYLVPGEDPVERYLMAAGGVTVLLILLGLVLNYLPGGLTRSSYAVGWAVLGSCLLAVDATRQRPGGAALWRVPASFLASFALLGAATAVAFLIGAAGVHKQNQQPVLALSAPAYGSTDAEILVDSVNAGGAYELLVLPDGRPGGSYSLPVELRAKGAHRAELSVQLPAARCYWRVLLRAAGSRTPAERELILWTGTSSAALHRRGPGHIPGASTTTGLRARSHPALCATPNVSSNATSASARLR
jgi:hypothetical protein